MLNDKKKLLRHYTQNIDGLDIMAGLDMLQTIECHGHIRSSTCLNCGRGFNFKYLQKYISKKEIPKCDKCSSRLIKPNVVLFGEQQNFDLQESLREFLKCDYLIIMGTSLVVEP